MHEARFNAGRCADDARRRGASSQDESARDRPRQRLVLGLQRLVGNRAVARMVATQAPARRGVVQRRWQPLDIVDLDGVGEWIYRPLARVYTNTATGAEYDPESRTLDYRHEPLGFSELSEAEHEALMDEITVLSGHAFVDDDNSMTYDSDRREKGFLDRPEIHVGVDEREHYHTLLEIEHDGVDVGELLRAAREKMAAAIPARELVAGGRVGFEFQELTSDVTVVEKPEERDEDEDEPFAFDERAHQAFEKAVEGADRTLEPRHFGRDKRWWIVADGQNLEFVTAPFSSLRELTEVMAEVEDVAWTLLRGEPGTTYLIGDDTVVTVNRAADKAQPQANVDIPLDVIRTLVAEVRGDPTLRDMFFGVHGHHWNLPSTEDELHAIATLSAGIDALPNRDLAEEFGIGATETTKLASIRGFLLLLGQAAIHRAFFKTQLQKDQPLLAKTDMGRTWKALLEDGIVEAKNDQPEAIAELLERSYPPFATGTAPQVLDLIVDTVIRKGRDPVWSNLAEPREAGEDRLQVVMELRRMPILGIGEWGSFALETYGYFVAEAESESEDCQGRSKTDPRRAG